MMNTSVKNETVSLLNSFAFLNDFFQNVFSMYLLEVFKSKLWEQWLAEISSLQLLRLAGFFRYHDSFTPCEDQRTFFVFF